MSIHKEIAFEDGIFAHLGAHGWLCEAGSADHYDWARALFVEDLAAWVQESQPLAWTALKNMHGGATDNVLADRLRAALDKQQGHSVLIWRPKPSA